MKSRLVFDIEFKVRGRVLPVDHGYSLFSAISSIIPHFHNAKDISIGPIRGRYIGNGLLDINPYSTLTIRTAPDNFAEYVRLGGKCLNVTGHRLLVGTPNTRAPQPASQLHAHFVTTRNGQDIDRFLSEIYNQMTHLSIMGEVSVITRKTMRIHGKQVVGYSVNIGGVSDESSLVLQAEGLGGRRKMGCGFFVPMRAGQ